MPKVEFGDRNTALPLTQAKKTKNHESCPRQGLPITFCGFHLCRRFCIAILLQWEIFAAVPDDCIIFKVDIRAAKKPDKTRSSPRQNWDNFREINAIGKMSPPPALGELHCCALPRGQMYLV